MDLLELLKANDVNGFNAARGERNRPDLFAAELPEAQLEGVDLSEANLEKSDLTGAVLRDAHLMRTRLDGSDGSGLDASGAIAMRAKLRGAWWDGCVLNEADFSRADLAESVLTGGSAIGIRLSGAKLREANLSKCNLSDAEFVEAKLHKCDLMGADLTRADFTEATGTEAKFDGANLDGLLATRANFNESSFENASMVGGRFVEASFCESKLVGVDLKNADLTGADLRDADLSGADLTGASLANANLSGTVLSGAILSNADLTGHDPRALGLSDDAVASLSAWGATTVEGAPILITQPAGAAHGEKVAVLWLNHDSEEVKTLRWSVFARGVLTADGVLPYSGDGVLGRAVLRSESGFMLAVVQERPGGTSLVVTPLDLDGTVGVSQAYPMGYSPVSAPVIVQDKGGIVVYGLARRGPTFVCQRLEGGVFDLVYSNQVATGTGFWSIHHSIVATRGGVAIVANERSTGKPLRLPSSFPGKGGRVVPSTNGAVAVWFEASLDEDKPGHLMWARLGGRGEPQAQVLKEAMAVAGLDVRAVGGTIQVCWLERHGMLSTIAFAATLPDGKMQFVEAAGDNGLDIRFARTTPDSPPVLLITTFDEALTVVRDGQRVGEHGGDGE